ncbi:hypothetical protein [Vibrio crassostreae]|uniref:hypothetical protein n=1 Tax=Vibrio crassostreae TaxID=246167 RepID=UPI000F49BC45|nr:hypothetical protein [Vibrio crassostreae]ROO57921.1 hypothetical protein EDB56_1011069 [Vibrio crassostreae]ROO74247.1 hypothetical protein EDB57_0676 [Vibrio crassostreae]ROO76808.1 hypothetical protein EDB53_0636 [Vibrio crassostreae]ROR70468.1 hypothetical protein EDB59_1123 [Vibrio crassostreae]ROR75621.1 hypothetical protein EDB54_1133 [Vibrio crassostreae]
MKVFSKSRVATCVLAAIPAMALAKDTGKLEKLGSETTGIEITKPNQAQDSSRIYLEQGAIWASRDITRFDPVLDVSVSDELEVEQGTLRDSVGFTITTNYGYYIKKYQLEVYRVGDFGLSEPIAVLGGDKLANDSDINWDGQTDVDYQFEVGEQLMFRLKAWDKDGNMDVTTVGVTDLVKPDSEVDIDRNDNDDEESKDKSYGQAKLMRHNIPTNAGLAKFIGTGLKGVDKVIIGEDEFDVEDGNLYAEQYLPTDSYIFPTKVVFDNGDERRYKLYVRIPDTYYAQTGLADLYVGKNNVSGNNSALSVDDQYQDDIYNQGRLAYFGQGKFGDKLRVTTHFDTRESEIKDMFKHPFASEDSDVFDILEDDDELYYGNYGDSSNIEKVVNTKGKVYLNVEYDKSQYLWGNYNTGLTGTENNDYNRSLYGFKADYRTRDTTQYGEDRLNVVGFTAEADSLYAHDEFLGTGGSLYFLRHGEAVPGSDKVYVKVKDESGLVQNEIPLEPGVDYDFDPYQGRIILTKPLDNILSDSFGSVIENGDDYENFLVVDYEYVPQGSDSLDAMSYGGRAKGWINDYVGVGVTYATQEKDNQDYESYGTDLTLRATEGTYIKAEFAHSEGTQTESNFVSIDGGLTFTPIGDTLEDREGDSIQITAVTSLYDLAPTIFGAVGNDLKLWYRDKDAGYSYASSSDDLEQEAYGAELRLQATDRLAVLSRFSTNEERDVDGNLEADTETIEVETQVKITEHIKVSAAGQQTEELNQNDEQSDATLAGVRLEYMWDSDNSVYIKGQTTVSQSDDYDENDSASIGAEFQVLEDLSLGGEYTDGDRGQVAEATVTYDVSDDHSTYVTYVDDNYEGENNVIVGQRADLTSSVDFYQENQFVDENDGHGRIDSYGFGYDVTEDVEMGIGYQLGEIEDDENITTERESISFNASIDLDDITLSHKFEYRVDKSEDDPEIAQRELQQIVTTNRYTHHLTEEYTLFGKYNYSITESETTGETMAQFTEATGGLAYRPIYNDRLNLLSRYTYIADFDQLDRDVDYQDETSQIIEVEAIYSIDQHWDVGTKYAHKDKEQAFERASGANEMVKSDIDLYGLSASYRVMKEWDITGEYHWKTDTLNDELEHGALVSVNKHIGDNFKMGIGYNFSAFDSDLTNDDDYDASGVFINLVGKI